MKVVSKLLSLFCNHHDVFVTEKRDNVSHVSVQCTKCLRQSSGIEIGGRKAS